MKPRPLVVLPLALALALAACDGPTSSTPSMDLGGVAGGHDASGVDLSGVAGGHDASAVDLSVDADVGAGPLDVASGDDAAADLASDASPPADTGHDPPADAAATDAAPSDVAADVSELDGSEADLSADGAAADAAAADGGPPAPECERADDCAPFEDGDRCNGTFDCVAGHCEFDPGSVVVCEPAPPCFVAHCDGDTGECSLAPVVCDDGYDCTVDSCAPDTGECVANLAFCPPLVVNSVEDLAEPPDGTLTLRAALRLAAPGQVIVFDASLDGATVALSSVGAQHTPLVGEVMGMRQEPSGPVSYLVGYFERDYGRSALYAAKDVHIDASALPLGITLAWTGGRDNPARVMAVLGDLTLRNVTVRGGYSVAEDISDGDPGAAQPWTLARGAGLAVWGVATLRDCTVHGNSCVGDFDSSRDRGAYGGGLYANVVDLAGCVVSGNTIVGGGAAGGGVFSVGGARHPRDVSSIVGSSITGNRISALFTYGGGIYSDGGGIGNLKTLVVRNSTVARNVVEPAPGVPPFLLSRGYWRGGGIYMSNGHLHVHDCTVVENEVYGWPRTDGLGRRNLAGGVAATVGNAHAAETMVIGRSIIAGNSVHELGPEGPLRSYAHDVFTGSLLHFHSEGYNRVGVLDFSQILVPVGVRGWSSLCRKHYPEVGDAEGVAVADVLDLPEGVAHSDAVVSAGVDAAEPAVLSYTPGRLARDQVPVERYDVEATFAEYDRRGDGPDDFLRIMLARLERHYALEGFSEEFVASFEAFLQAVDLDANTPGAQPYTDPDGQPILTLDDARWFGPRATWPKELPNYPYIEFWHHLDRALAGREIPGIGSELLGDAAWSALFRSGRLDENPDLHMSLRAERTRVVPSGEDQTGTRRPVGPLHDVGAVEAR